MQYTTTGTDTCPYRCPARQHSGIRARPAARLPTIALATIAMTTCLSATRPAPAAQVIINELQAVNQTTLADNNGDYSDWIELYNTTTNPVNLLGWSLTDDAEDLRKWLFPASTLPGHGFMIVYASDKDRCVAGQPLHTNFKLSGAGEYLALVRPDGVTVEYAFAPAFPAQEADTSYGVAWQGSDTVLVPSGAVCRAAVPTNDAWSTNWQLVAFDDSSWTAGRTGVGYDAGAGFAPYIGLDVAATMSGASSSAYARVPFILDQPDAYTRLTLNARFDDGFVAYLNGARAAAGNAPALPTWDSGATTDRLPTDAKMPVAFPVEAPAASAMQPGTNLLAVHILDWKEGRFTSGCLMLPELIGTVDAPDASDHRRFFTAPTPGAPNGTGYEGTSDPVRFSRPGGACTNAFTLTLTQDAPDTLIRYTTDGSLPSETSALYTGPITVSATTLVRARAFTAGYSPSPVESRSYFFVASDVQSFSSKLPIVIVETFAGGEIPNVEPKQDAFIAIIEPGDDGRASLLQTPSLEFRAGIRRRGESTMRYTSTKPNLAVESRGEAEDEDRDIEPLGLPPESDWVLFAPYAFDNAFVRLPLAFELSNLLGEYGSRTRYVEVFLHVDDDTIRQAEYYGLYILMERIKIDRERVDIKKLSPGDTAEPEITGGYIFRHDKDDPDKPYFSANSLTFEYYDPPADELTSAQQDWLVDYVANFDTVINGAGFLDPVTGYAPYIDADNWIASHIVNMFAKNIDWPWFSTYFHKDRSGRLRQGPAWDFDRSMESRDTRDDPYDTWSAGADFFTSYWWTRVFRDPDFWQRYIDEWAARRADVLSEANIVNLIGSYTNQIGEAVARDLARWTAAAHQPRTGAGDGVPVPPYNMYLDGTWQGEVRHLEWWLTNRLNWIDAQLLRPPTVSRPSGYVDQNATFTLSTTAGTVIYYTLDGTDPRAPGGTPAPTAALYTPGAALVVTGSTLLHARAYNGRTFSSAPYDAPWSAMTEAAFRTARPTLAVTELMIRPRAPDAAETAAGFSRGDFEFVEIANVGDSPVDMRGVQLSDGIDFDFTTTGIATLAPGQCLVVADNATAFTNRYGRLPALCGNFSGNLDDGGEQVTLELRGIEPLTSFTYETGRGWPLAANGAGHSLVPVSPAGATNSHALDYGGNWRASAFIDGSPGTAADPTPPHDLTINELAAHTDYRNPTHPEYDSNDWLELFNAGTSTVTLSPDWYLSDDEDVLRKWPFPGTHAPLTPGDWLALDEVNDFHHPIDSGFGLNKAGDSLFLSYLPGTAADRVVDCVKFKGQANGTTLARYPDGTANWFRLAPTRGAANAAPTNTVTISEVMYHPADADEAGGADLEFIELHNPTALPAQLWNDDGAWRIDGPDFTFPSNTVIASGAYLVVVGFNPTNREMRAAFLGAYGLAEGSVTLAGPFDGHLSNRGERIALERPQASDDPEHPADRSWIIVDEVIYFDSAPWTEQADGTGLSLRRIATPSDGNAPENWVASANPTPGAPPDVIAIHWPLPGAVLYPVNRPLDVRVDTNAISRPLDHVEIYDGDTRLATIEHAPFEQPLTSLVEGVHTLGARAIDDLDGVYTARQSVVMIYGPPPNPLSYQRLRITAAGYDRTNTLDDFPLPVRLSTNIHGFSYSQFVSPDGADLRFTDADAARALAYDIETWNTNGESLLWVRVPALAAGDTIIWACWGNPALTNRPAYATNGTAWSPAYHGVWHMDDSWHDASRSLADATPHGTTTAGGIAGTARTFNGIDDYVEPGAPTTWYGAHAEAMTISLWAYPGGTQSGGAFGSTAANRNLYIKTHYSRFFNWASGAASAEYFSTPITTLQWQHVALVLDAGHAYVSRNGDTPTAIGVYTTFSPAGAPLIGCLASPDTPSTFFAGRIDEVRIAAAARSADWLWAEYHSLTDQDFLDYVFFPPSTGGDDDDDGLPDSWEQHFFGGSTNPLTAGEQDWDGDRASNLAEYIAGTDPTNADSVFRMLPRTPGIPPAFSFPATQATGEWYTGQARYYRVEETTNIVTGPWLTIPGYEAIPADGQLVVVTNSLGDRCVFFRGHVWLE